MIEVNENGVILTILETGVFLEYQVDSEVSWELYFDSLLEAEKQIGKVFSEIDMFDLMPS